MWRYGGAAGGAEGGCAWGAWGAAAGDPATGGSVSMRCDAWAADCWRSLSIIDMARLAFFGSDGGSEAAVYAAT